MPDQPDEEEIPKWDRWFAVECNNRAWSLAELPVRSSAEDIEMLNAAYAAAFHWHRVGTQLHEARARMLLGHVHALLGHGELAMHYAQSSFAFIASHDSPDWEVAFAHAILANAASATKDTEAHSRHYALAKNAGGALTNAKDRAIFDATFSRVPVP